MKVSLAWLQDHLDLSKFSLDELSDILTFAGIEVEGLQRMPENLVAARILSSEPHPDADKLSICQVDDGSGSPRQIVCGAKNYRPGHTVPLALPGCALAPDFTIRKGKLRGIESHGMLCSAGELGLPDAEEGLMILPDGLDPGTPMSEIFPPVFDLEVTPNRPDLLSHLGLARDLAALTGLKLKGSPALSTTQIQQRQAKKKEIAIEAPESCPFYSGRFIRGVKIQPSPAWLRDKLQAIGLRPINNVVDITNYVLMEMGQPLHAFDLAKLDGGIVVRQASKAETFTTLDGEERTLSPDDCVIADRSRPHALAGIMGGEDSGVTESTRDVFLEAAYFTPSRVRRSSHRLDLHSDSSYRFERGVDPAQILGASEFATRLIVELAGGEPDTEVLIAGHLPESETSVPLDPAHCRKLIGCPIPTSRIDSILRKLGLRKSGKTWQIPSYRLDLRRPVDLIEEIARVHGLDEVPSQTHSLLVPPSKADHAYDAQWKIRRQLVHLGFLECQTIKLIGEKQLDDDLAGPRRGLSLLAVKNPMTDTHSWLRPSLVPSLLRVAEHNVRMGCSDLALFEMGTVFLSNPKGAAIEEQQLAILITGKARPASWMEPEPPHHDIHSLRGILEALSGLPLALEPAEKDRLLLAANLVIGKDKVGIAGQIHPARARDMDLNQPVLVAEINLKKWSAAAQEHPRFRDLPRFPAVTRDVAIEVPADLPNQKIVDLFDSLQEPLLEAFSLFDQYLDPTGEKLAADRKSLAYSLTYRDPEGTLESATVDAVHEKILQRMRDSLPVQFR